MTHKTILRRTGNVLARLALVALALLVGSSGTTQAAKFAYVSTSAPFNAVFKFDAETGVKVPVEFFDLPPIGNVLGTPQGIAIGPDGLLYIAAQDTFRIVAYDRNSGTLLDTLVPRNGVIAPGGMTFGPDGSSALFVADNSGPSTGRVERVTTPGGVLSTFTVENSGHQCDGATTPAFGTDGDLYVTCFNSNEVAKYNGTTGDFIQSFPTTPLNSPAGLAFSPDGTKMYVSYAESGGANNGVAEYNAVTGALLNANFINATPPSLDLPNGIAFGPDQNNDGSEDLYVTYRNNPQQVISVYDGTSGALINGSIYQVGLAPKHIIFEDTGPPPTSQEWTKDNSGEWIDPLNWDPGRTFGVPNANDQTAVFGDMVTSPTTVVTTTAVTVKTIQFDNATHSYAIGGLGGVNLDADSGNATIDVDSGTHEFQATIDLQSNTDVDVASGAMISFENALNLNNNTLAKTGSGTLLINSTLSTGGGTVTGLGGVIGGSGIVGGDLVNLSGMISPGNSPPLTGSLSDVPEPSSSVLLLLSVLGAGALIRRRHAVRAWARLAIVALALLAASSDTTQAGNIAYIPTNDFDDAILRYDAQYGFVDPDFSIPFTSGLLTTPHGLAINPNDPNVLYVASHDQNAILRYNRSDGTPIFPALSLGFRGVDRPNDMTFGPGGSSDLFVAMSGNDNSVRRIPTPGAGAVQTANPFTTGGTITNPISVAFGPNDDLWVTARDSNNVAKFNGTTGAFIENVLGPSDITAPAGFTFSPDGSKFYVSTDTANSQNNVVRQYDTTTGNLLAPNFITDLPPCLFCTGKVEANGLRFGPDQNGDGNDDLYVALSGDLNPFAVAVYDGSTGAMIDGSIYEVDLAPKFVLFEDTGPAATSLEWKRDSSGEWVNPFDWNPNDVPTANNQTAVFGGMVSSPTTVVVRTDVTVKEIQFDNGANSYAIGGLGSVNLEADSGNATIDVDNGTHQFQAEVKLQSHTDVDVASGAILSFNNALNLNGNTLAKTGGGTLLINNVLTTGGGTVTGLAGVIGGSGIVGGDLVILGGTISPGNSPPVAGSLSDVPEPSGLGLFVLGLLGAGALICPIRRRSGHPGFGSS